MKIFNSSKQILIIFFYRHSELPASWKYFFLIPLFIVGAASLLIGQSAVQEDLVNIYLEDTDWTIPFEALYANDQPDLYGQQSAFVYQMDMSCTQYHGIGTLLTMVTLNLAEETVQLPVLPVGIYRFCIKYLYFNGIDEQTQEVFVVVSASDYVDDEQCCPLDCNYVCKQDFESYAIDEPYVFGYPEGKVFGHNGNAYFKFKNYSGPLLSGASNYIYISSDGEQRFLTFMDMPSFEIDSVSIGNYRYYYEKNQESGYIVKLRDPVNHGESVIISFDATAYGGNPRSNDSMYPGFWDDARIRLFAMRDDFSASPVTINYPYTTHINPFAFGTFSNDLGYFIQSGYETSIFGIPVSKELVTGYAPIQQVNATDQYTPLIGVSGLDEFTNYTFKWTNNTSGPVSAIMIVADGSGPINPLWLNEPAISTREEPQLAYTYYYNVAVDNFSVTKNAQFPVCIEGNTNEECTGTSTQNVIYEICRCDEKPSTQSVTFTVRIEDIYDGINVVLPGGSFNANGEATVTLANSTDCAVVNFTVAVTPENLAGLTEFPLYFGDASGDCDMCSGDVYVVDMIAATLELQDCNFTCECDEVNNIGNKLSTTTWSSLTTPQKEARCLAVEGILIIDENVTIAEKVFIMQGGSEIRIGDQQVIFESCELKGCDYMWNGITANHQNAILKVRNSVVKDAVYGIWRNHHQALIHASNSYFENCYIGIHLSHASNVTFPLSVDNAVAVIYGNDFHSTKLLPHLSSQTAGKLGYAGINIKGGNEHVGFSDPGTTNSFSLLGNGILATDANVTVGVNTFSNIHPLAYYNTTSLVSGFGIRHEGVPGLSLFVGEVAGITNPLHNGFSDVHNAVYTNSQVQMNNTKMQDVNIGLRLNASAYASVFSENNEIVFKRVGYLLAGDKGNIHGLIQNNSIYADNTTFVATSGINMQAKHYVPNQGLHIHDNYISGPKLRYGIQVHNATGMTISNNTITTSNLHGGITIAGGQEVTIKENAITSTGPTYGRGVSVSMLHRSDIECNTITGAFTGIDIHSNNVGSELTANTLDLYDGTGLWMHQGALYTSRENLGVHKFKGNRFEYDATPGYHARHDGDGDQIEASRFITTTNALPYFPENYLAGNEDISNPWFSDDFMGTEAVCAYYPLAGQTDWLLPLISDSLTYAIYNAQLRSQAQAEVYRFITESDSLIYDTELEDFFESYTLSPEGEVMQARMHMESLLRMPSATTALLNALSDSLKGLTGQIASLQVALPANPSIAELTSYKAAVQSFTVAMATINVLRDSLLADYHQGRASQLYSLLPGLDVINTTDVPGEYARVVTYLEAQYLAGNMSWLTTYALTTLLGIAGLCPDYGGPAVYWARSLICQSMPFITWSDSLICLDTASLLTSRPTMEALPNAMSKQIDEYNVWPNPSNGILQLRTDNDFQGFIVIQDVLGRIAGRFIYEPGKTIDLTGYSGLLFIHWIDLMGNQIHTNKQLIVK